MKISAAVAEQGSHLMSLQTLELDEPRDDEILVRIKATGVCHTDISMRDGRIPCPYPAVLGHEGAGIVERVGANVNAVAPGDHVILTTMSCGVCNACKRGAPYYCAQLRPLNLRGSRDDGSTTFVGDNGNGAHVHGAIFRQSSFASYAIATERNAVKVPKDIPFEILAPLGCGVQTGAGAVLNSLKPPAGGEIAIFGVGGVGMSAVMAAKVSGCTRIIAVDLNDDRLALARVLGATEVINAGKTNPVEAILALCPGGIAYSVEAAGNPVALKQAVESLCMGGSCVLVGAPGRGVSVSIDMSLLLNGRSVRGVIMGESIPQIFLPQLLTLYRNGQFPINQIVTTYPFAEINRAIEDSERGRTVKAVVVFDSN